MINPNDLLIRVKKLDPDAKIPELGSQMSAGLDIATIESVTIPPRQRATLKTGIAMAIPAGMVGLIWPRSKLGAKFGTAILAGVIDSDYRGEVMIAIHNTSMDPIEFRKGDKIAQMVVQQHFSWFPIDVVDSLDETKRGAKGINSTEMRLN